MARINHSGHVHATRCQTDLCLHFQHLLPELVELRREGIAERGHVELQVLDLLPQLPILSLGIVVVASYLLLRPMTCAKIKLDGGCGGLRDADRRRGRVNRAERRHARVQWWVSRAHGVA